VDSVANVEPERGLLGIAVDPSWPQRPFVYVYYTALGGTIRVSRYTVNGNLSDGSSGVLAINPASRYDVLRDISDLLEFHNAGAMRFGADGDLYIAIGDDGDDCAAQDSTGLKGVLLRIDVRHLPTQAGGPPNRADLAPADNPFAWSSNTNMRLVWAMGLRNPFRFHIDPANGAIFVGDVGFETYEEVDRLTGSNLNLGWPWFEGPGTYATDCNGTPAPSSGLTAPIYYYDRPGVAASVIDAGPYRGSGCQHGSGRRRLRLGVGRWPPPLQGLISRRRFR